MNIGITFRFLFVPLQESLRGEDISLFPLYNAFLIGEHTGTFPLRIIEKFQYHIGLTGWSKIASGTLRPVRDDNR
jgi:hypothetical protein